MHEISRRRLLQGAALAPFVGRCQTMDYRIIDPHVHVWKHDPEVSRSLPAQMCPIGTPRRKRCSDLMKANGVSKTVIIQVIHYSYDNRYLADVLKQYPGTFQGVCRVDPLDPAAPDHLSQLTRTRIPRRAAQPGRERIRRLVSRSADAAAVEALRSN